MLTRPKANLSASRYEYAVQCLRRLQPGLAANIVFDVGAGDGRMKEQIELTGLRWYGFDLNPLASDIVAWDLVDRCPMTGPRANVMILLDVIEHLFNPGIAIKNIRDILAPDGRLILTMPNPRWSRSRIHALLTGYPTCFTESDLGNHHVFTPWPHILNMLLSQQRFVVEEYVTLDGKTEWPVDRPLSLRYPLRCLHAIANMLIEHLDPSACGMSFGLVARLQN